MTAINLENPAALAAEIKSGRIWSAPGWGIEMAVDAINEGRVPYPSYIPDEYLPLITVDAPPDVGNFEPLRPGTDIDPLTGEPVVGIPMTPSEGAPAQPEFDSEPVDIEGALAAPTGGEPIE